MISDDARHNVNCGRYGLVCQLVGHSEDLSTPDISSRYQSAGSGSVWWRKSGHHGLAKLSTRTAISCI
jgi:hypothetical protein